MSNGDHLRNETSEDPWCFKGIKGGLQLGRLRRKGLETSCEQDFHDQTKIPETEVARKMVD
jgi:hypothetical protein